MRFTILAFIMILAAAMSRLIPHPPNFTPVAAMALVGGAYLDKRFAFIVPVAAMALSDWFIGFHSLMPFVYVSFLITGLVGLWVARRQSAVTVVGASLVSSLLFFVVTNGGVWILSTSLYPKTLDGLVACYIAAIPFFRNALIGDLLYTVILFGLFEGVRRVIVRRQAVGAMMKH